MGAPRRSVGRRTPTGRVAIACPLWCVVKPRTEFNDIVSAEDWVQTLVAAAREPDIQIKLLHGYNAGGKSFKEHLDGYDQRDLLAGKGPDKRREFFYWTDDGNFAGLLRAQSKAVFREQPAHGLEVWVRPWCRCARRSCSTCVPTRSSARNK